MNVSDAKQAYAQQLNALQCQRRTLRKALEEQQNDGNTQFDRVKISRELRRLDAQYEQGRAVMEYLTAREIAIRRAKAARRRDDAADEQTEELETILEIFRRISSGGRVPPADETQLMEYSSELYLAAKNMALLKAGQGKEYKSRPEGGGAEDRKLPAGELAGDAEIAAATSEGES